MISFPNPFLVGRRNRPGVRGWFPVAATGLPICLALSLTGMGGELDGLLPGLQSYRFGADRKPLARIEQLVHESLGDPARRAALAAELAPVLTSDAAYDAKQFVCRQLALVGGDPETPALLAALRAGDASLAHMAVYALGRNHSPVATAGLLNALDRVRGGARLNVIGVLADRPVPAVAQALDRLADDADPATREAALAALGRMGGVPARRALARRLSSTAPPAPPALVEAAVRAVWAVEDPDPEPGLTLSLIRSLEDSRQSPAAQARALALRHRRGMLPAGQVLQFLVHPFPEVRREAARLVHELPAEELLKLPPEGARSLPVPSRRALLGALSSPGGAPLALALLKDPEPSVRLAALTALGRLGDAGVAAELVRVAASTQGEEREAARKSLARIAARTTNARLLDLLSRSASVAVQREIILALRDRGAAEATPALRKRALSDEASLAVVALRALRDLAPAGELPALLDLLSRVAEERAGEAEIAVAAVVRRAPDVTAATRTLLDRLEAAASPAAKGRLLRVLGSLHSPAALAALRDALNGDQPALRLTALRVLSEWPDAAPLEALRQAAATGDARMRALARRGLVRMIGLDRSRPVAARYALLAEVLEQAEDDATRRAVLGSLGTTPVKAAFDRAEALASRPGLRAEAQLALVQLGRALAGAFPQEVRKTLERIAAAPATPDLGRQARETLKVLSGFDGFITAWEVSPAYQKEGLDCQRLFDVPFPPEPGGPDEEVPWEILPAAAQPEKPWLMDILAVHPGLQRVAYARTRVWAGEPRELVLELGTDDGVKLWVNGALVHARNAVRAAAPGQEKPRVRLRAGWNDLLVKITQNIMGWEFCAKFVEADGKPATGLRFALPATEE